MTTLSNTVLLGIATAVLLACAAALPAHAQANCEWYAKTALRQQQLNEEKRCGFKGEGWHPDLKAHLNWCTSVAPDAWKEQAKARDQLLAQCAKK